MLRRTKEQVAADLPPRTATWTARRAVDRAHRIGQSRTVMVYRLVATGTIEEKVMALKEGKSRLFESVLGGEDLVDARLTAADVTRTARVTHPSWRRRRPAITPAPAEVSWSAWSASTLRIGVLESPPPGAHYVSQVERKERRMAAKVEFEDDDGQVVRRSARSARSDVGIAA